MCFILHIYIQLSNSGEEIITTFWPRTNESQVYLKTRFKVRLNYMKCRVKMAEVATYTVFKN